MNAYIFQNLVITNSSPGVSSTLTGAYFLKVLCLSEYTD